MWVAERSALSCQSHNHPPHLCTHARYLQTAWLSDSVAEDLGDQEALEAELERELAAAEEGEEAAAAPTPATGKKKVGAGHLRGSGVGRGQQGTPGAGGLGGSLTSKRCRLKFPMPPCVNSLECRVAQELTFPSPALLTPQGKREGTPPQEDEQRVLAQMRAEGLMATPAGAAPQDGAAAAGGAAAVAASSPLPEGSGGPPPKEGPGARRIRREVFYKAPNGSWQVRLAWKGGMHGDALPCGCHMPCMALRNASPLACCSDAAAAHISQHER